MTAIPAKCPHCFGSGCDKCVDGEITVTIPEDDWYSRHCTNPLCGFDNGGCQGSMLYDLKDQTCVMCDHSEVVWIPMCEEDLDPPWLVHQHGDFANYLRAMGRAMGGRE